MTTPSFTGKTALVIGGTSGMGKATANLLLTKGAHVIVASKSPASIEAAVDELKAFGNVTGQQLNLASPESVDTFIAALDKEDRIDFLVNASGIFAPKPFLESTPEDYDALLNINRGFY